MLVSPCSSDCRWNLALGATHEVQLPPAWKRRLVGLICVLVLGVAAGCATVRPEDKEYLAEPSMTWADTRFAARHESHIVENREGSTGGSQTKGGGCGCN